MSKTDPLIKFFFSNSPQASAKLTKATQNNLNPDFNLNYDIPFNLSLPELKKLVLYVQVFDEGNIGSDPLGGTFLELMPLIACHY
jgi:hypothetical protein